MIKEIFSESIETKQQVINDETFIANIDKSIETVLNALNNNKKILIMGNGGSAADAQHFAGEFINRFLIDRKPLPAISLSTDSSVITCIGNDYSFDEIFKKQIEAIGSAGDILIGITTSGDSANILEGFKTAKEKEIVTVGLLGKNGGKAKNICDIPIIVKSDSLPGFRKCILL